MSRREHSTYELRTKLLKRGFETADIERILTTLEKQGWLNHDRFIESTLRRCLSLGYGPLKVQAVLRATGVSEQAMRHPSYVELDWLAHLTQLCQRYFREKACDSAEWLKRARFLQSRGFTYTQIKYVLEKTNDHDIE
ncbi:MAG: regulatory protein RecX [Pseudomonadota bacterium]